MIQSALHSFNELNAKDLASSNELVPFSEHVLFWGETEIIPDKHPLFLAMV